MKRKRTDLRTSRKSGPKLGTIVSKRGNRISKSTVHRSKLHNDAPYTGTSSKVNKSRVRRSKGIVLQNATLDNQKRSVRSTVAEFSILEPTSSDRRRRTNTIDYIKKRFLYEPDDVPKKQRNARNATPHRSTLLSMTRNKRAGELLGNIPRKKKRGRPKARMIEPINNSETSVSRIKHMKPSRKRKKRIGSHSCVVHNSMNAGSPILDQVGLFYSTQNGQFIEENPRIDKPEYSMMEAYSDLLLDDFHSQPNQHMAGGRKLRDRGRRRHPDRASRINVAESMYKSYFGQNSLLSPSSRASDSEQHTDDLEFGSSPDRSRFDRSRHLDDLEPDQMGYLSSPLSHDLSDEQSQAVAEDQEEENLLAPKLSILSGPATITGEDSVILTTLSNTNAALSGGTVSTAGGSRRKSPVRPMQVVRTKFATNPPVAPTTNLQMTVIDSTSDCSSLIYTQPSDFGQRFPTSDQPDNFLSTIYHQSTFDSMAHVSEVPDIPTTSDLWPTSILRLPTPKIPSATPISVRSVLDHNIRVSETDNSSVLNGTMATSSGSACSPPLLPTILTQNSNLTTTLPPVPRAPLLNPTTNRPTLKGTSHSSLISTSKHRPSILKRSLIPNTNIGNVILPAADMASSPISKSAPSNSDSDAVQTQEPNTSISSKSIITNSTQVEPTKVLHLISTSTIAHPSSHLTASDRLFGRRPSTYGKSSLMTTLPHPSTQHLPEEDFGIPAKVPLPNPSSYRYAVLRGSSDGKRYLYFGTPGIFDRSAIAPLVPPKLPPNQMTEPVIGEPVVTSSQSLIIDSSPLPPNPDVCDAFVESLNRHSPTDYTSEQSVLSHIQSTFDITTAPTTVPTHVVSSVAAAI